VSWLDQEEVYLYYRFMLKLRLQRRGKNNYATYRVVVADQRAPIKGKFVADVGYYNPHTSEFKVEADKVKEWLGNGVKASPTVHNLLVENKIIKGGKVTSWRPKIRKEEEESEEKTDSKAEGEPTEKAEGIKEEGKQTSDSEQKEEVSKDKEEDK
jgi:small subunit ribosomal protein S16